VSLDDYRILNPVTSVRAEPIPINLHNCQISDFSFPVVADVYYNVYTPIIHILMTQFTETTISNPRVATPSTCGYTVTYTVKWRDFFGTALDLPKNSAGVNWITWNPAAFRYEVYTDDPKDINHTR